MLRRQKFLGAAMFALFAGLGSAQAGNVIYQPVNPAFGGSPLNGSWLMQQGQAQNQFTKSGSGGSSYTPPTPGQLFANQLTSQIYSSLANQITQAIFGQNAQTSGSYSFGGTQISFEHVGGEVKITIFDGTTSTTVSVPAAP